MSWTYKTSEKAAKQLRKLGKDASRKIVGFLDDRIEGTNDPRKFGKPLKGDLGEYWRYRVENYRILCKIVDSEMIVLVVTLGHRRDVYD